MSTTEKFQRATEYLYQGEQDAAAKLFRDGVAEEVARVAPSAVNVDELARTVTAKVQQQLKSAPAIEEIFNDYPEIKAKRAYAEIADRYAAENVARGVPIDVAIRKAGKTVAEEFGLGKNKQPSGRRSGSPPSGSESQPSSQPEANDEWAEQYAGAIADMRDRRPGF